MKFECEGSALRLISFGLRHSAYGALLYLFLALTIGPQSSLGQSPAPIYVGGGISGSFLSHSLDIPIYNNDQLCGVFQNGTSILPNGFLLFERSFTQDAHGLWLAPRLHLNSMGATITTGATDSARVRHLPDSTLVPATRSHKLDATILALGVDLFVRYPITNSLWIFGGPSISYLLRRDAVQTETILSPANAVFTAEGTPTRTLASGEIANSRAIFAAFTVGGSLDAPVSSKVTISPELSIALPLTSFRTDYRWRATSVSLGVAIKFNLAQPQSLAVIHQEPERPKSDLTGYVKISGVRDSAGHEIETQNPQLRVEEFVRREAFPTLNEIFFDSMSSTIPARYHLLTPSDTAIPAFNASQFVGKDALEVYHETLNILGSRLAADRSIAITVTGSNSNSGSEANAMSLSRARAESVKSYLVDVWKIDPKRIQTAAVTLPRNASSSDTKQGAEENRRAEITSTNTTFLDPFVVEEVDRTMNPPKLRIRTKSSSALPLSQSSITLEQGSRGLHQFSTAEQVQDWTPTEDQLPRTDTPMVAKLFMKDVQGTTYVATDTAHVEQLTIKRKREERQRDKIIEHYNLVTFDFDKANLDERSLRVIDEIAKNITPNDVITLRGYTDMTGDRQHNLTLSSERARAVEEALAKSAGAKAGSVKFAASGEGESDLVDNRLPEGRFLSRTVWIKVERSVAGQ